MVKESPARQHTILSTLATLGAQVTIYQAGAGYRTNIERRGACLERLVEDIATAGCARLMLESEQGEEERDRRLLYRETGRRRCPTSNSPSGSSTERLRSCPSESHQRHLPEV